MLVLHINLISLAEQNGRGNPPSYPWRHIEVESTPLGWPKDGGAWVRPRHCAHVLAFHRAHDSVEVDADSAARGDVRRRLDDNDAPAVCRGIRHETLELDGRADGERVPGY